MWRPSAVRQRKARQRVLEAEDFRAGFTLAEISIVILVMSILFTILFGTFFSVGRIVKEGGPITQANYESMLALENIRSSLSQVYYHKDVKRLVFVGKQQGAGDSREDVLTFAAVHPGSESLGVPAVREVSFYLKKDDEGEFGTLMRREDQTVDKYPGQGGQHYPILKNVKGLRFEYTWNLKDWQSEWHHQKLKRVPRLIRISLTVMIGNKSRKYETMAYVGLYNK